MQHAIRVAAIFVLFALAAIPANAQSASVVILPGGCGTGSYPQNIGYLTIDSTGHLCTSGSGGGGGAATIANGADTAEGSTTDAPATVPTTSSAATVVALLKALTNVANAPATFASQYPSGSVAITASATGTTAATTATLAASASLHTYICGFSIRANATAAATANSTVTGTITGTLNYTQWTAPNASGIGLTEQIFSPCVPSSAINTGIAVISAAPGTGGVVSVAAWGYQL